jgi:hypothetical protein
MSSKPFRAGVGSSETQFFRKSMMGRISLALCRLKSKKLV